MHDMLQGTCLQLLLAAAAACPQSALVLGASALHLCVLKAARLTATDT